MTLLGISLLLLGKEVEFFFKSDIFENFLLHVLIFKAMTQPVLFTWLKSTVNTRTMCEICSKLIKTPERCHIVLVFSLLTLNK